jgi:hypothetical protein
MLRDVDSLDDYVDRVAAFRAKEQREFALERAGWKSAGTGHVIASELEEDLDAPREANDGVFLSHAHEDAPIAALLCSALNQAGVGGKVFVASRPGDIPPGNDWLESIRVHLRHASTYIILVTKHSIDRRWVWFETGAAWMSGQRLIPVVAGLDKADVPVPLGAHQVLSIHDPHELRALVSALGGDLTDADSICRVADSLVTRESTNGAPALPNTELR